MVILGIDPGLNATGFGVIRAEAGRYHVVNAGDIRPSPKQPLPDRLAVIHEGLSRLMKTYQPEVAVLEQIFTHQRFPTAASLMAHARGVACLAAQEEGIPLVQYMPTRIKRALSGRGNATKEQVARMVEYWLGVREPAWSADATDALALAIAHGHIIDLSTRQAAMAHPSGRT